MNAKSIARSEDPQRAPSDRVAAGLWLSLSRIVSAAARFMLAWPATAYRARQDMEQLGRMSERDLRDIGLIRQDLYDMQALPLGRSPTALLGRRVHERRVVARQRVTSRPDIGAWRRQEGL